MGQDQSSAESHTDRPLFSLNVPPGEAVLPPARVAVTGASSLVGSHIVRALLFEGYDVCACVHDPSDTRAVDHLRMFKQAPDCKGKLSFAPGNLAVEGSFNSAFFDAKAVVHCAELPTKNTDTPMKDVVQACIDATNNVYGSINRSESIKRVIHTSSVHTLHSFHKNVPNGFLFDEQDINNWSNEDSGDFQGLAKIRSEEIAHKEAVNQQHKYSVVILNLSTVFGQCLKRSHCKQGPIFIRNLLLHDPLPDIRLSFVDVKDVARAHILALMTPEAGGNRFIISGSVGQNSMRFPSMLESLKVLFPEYQFQFTSWNNGLWYNLSWFTTMSNFDRQVILSNIRYDNTKSETVLKMNYRSPDDTLRATVESMTRWYAPKMTVHLRRNSSNEYSPRKKSRRHTQNQAPMFERKDSIAASYLPCNTNTNNTHTNIETPPLDISVMPGGLSKLTSLDKLTPLDIHAHTRPGDSPAFISTPEPIIAINDSMMPDLELEPSSQLSHDP